MARSLSRLPSGRHIPTLLRLGRCETRTLQGCPDLWDGRLRPASDLRPGGAWRPRHRLDHQIQGLLLGCAKVRQNARGTGLRFQGDRCIIVLERLIGPPASPRELALQELLEVIVHPPAYGDPPCVGRQGVEQRFGRGPLVQVFQVCDTVQHQQLQLAEAESSEADLREQERGPGYQAMNVRSAHVQAPVRTKLRRAGPKPEGSHSTLYGQRHFSRAVAGRDEDDRLQATERVAVTPDRESVHRFLPRTMAGGHGQVVPTLDRDVRRLEDLRDLTVSHSARDLAQIALVRHVRFSLALW